MSSLGFSVQFAQSEPQLQDRCGNVENEEATQKLSAGNAGGNGVNGHAKKRSTTSSPPEETAAGVPPRLPENTDVEFRAQRSLTIDVMPRVDEGQEEVESVFMRDYDDEMDALQAQLREEMPPKTPRSIMMEDVRFEKEIILQSSPPPLAREASQDILQEVEPQEGSTQDVKLIGQTEPATYSSEWKPTATLLTLPPELILEISKYLPFCSHAALYDTCGRLNRVIRDNNKTHYERELAKAGANPRGESLLTRSIFAFQYLNRPSNAPESHPEFNIDSSFVYIRYLKSQSECVQDIADLLQSDIYMKFLLSEEGRKQLRLTAHGNHEPEDLSHKDDVDRDLMHLWEFVNYSVDKLVRTEVPMYYPYPDQKSYYDSSMPFPLDSPSDDAKAETLRKSVAKLAKDAQFPHDPFLVWERKRLRELRNEYWKEDTDNLSKVESKDMRWILEVIKAIFVGVIFKPFIEGPREKNKAILELKAKALRKASRNGTPLTPNEAISDTVMSESDQISYSHTYTEQEIRAYVSYLIAAGGMKLLLSIIRSATANNGTLTPEQFDSALSSWDKLRESIPVPVEFTKGFDSDKAREEEKAKNPDKEEFAYLWKPTRVERIWERDCKRGGWSNWEGWVAEYYLIA
ncbi:hypothetical protein ABW19_dt0201349 [Dactylella cylindrospora]|nr:hypothetical protein ABW19_dt0201349 [Dactylella cylindrospora]